MNQTSAGGPQGDAGATRPAGPTDDRTAASATGRRDVAAADGGGRGPRPPRWMIIAGAALVVVLVGVAVMLWVNRGGEPEVLEPEVVTLPLPTPTVEPVERAEGTAFQQALPSTVLQYALTALEDHPDLLAQGAIESYRLTYSDGGDQEVVVVAGQWATPEAAAAVMETAVAGAAEPEQGTVEVGGQQVGTYVLVPGEGTETLWWTNGTVLLQATGPAGAVMDVHLAYPL